MLLKFQRHQNYYSYVEMSDFKTLEFQEIWYKFLMSLNFKIALKTSKNLKLLMTLYSLLHCYHPNISKDT